METAAQGGGASEIVAVWLAEPALVGDWVRMKRRGNREKVYRGCVGRT